MIDPASVVMTVYPAATPEAPPKAPKRRKAFAACEANAIMKKTFDPLRWTVPGFLAEGLSILGGRQKLGKTWLAFDFAVAIAIGGKTLGSVTCDQGDVLYIDLENGERRIQRRLETFFPDEQTRPDLSRLQFVTDSPMLGPDFLECLDSWRESVRKPTLVVIDVMQRIKPPGNAARNAYENDYSTFAPLQQWATTNGITVLALHHVRKGESEDPTESLSGSNGFAACADTTLILNKDSLGISLYVRGRDIEETKIALRFDGGLFTAIGEATDVLRSKERDAIRAVLLKASDSMGPADIAAIAGMKTNNVKQLLFKMVPSGEVVKLSGRARYIHPERRDLDDDTPPPEGPITDNDDAPVTDDMWAAYPDNPPDPPITANHDNPVTEDTGGSMDAAGDTEAEGYRVTEVSGYRGGDDIPDEPGAKSDQTVPPEDPGEAIRKTWLLRGERARAYLKVAEDTPGILRKDTKRLNTQAWGRGLRVVCEHNTFVGHNFHIHGPDTDDYRFTAGDPESIVEYLGTLPITRRPKRKAKTGEKGADND